MCAASAARKCCSLLERARVGGLEERTCGLRIAARAPQPAALEVDARSTRRPRPRARRLVEQRVARLEVAAKPCDARELRQHLGAARVAVSSSSCVRSRASEPSRSSKSQSGRRRSSTRRTLARRGDTLARGGRRDAAARPTRAARARRRARAGRRPGPARRAVRASLAPRGAARGGTRRRRRVGYAFSPRSTRGATRA